MVKILVVEDDRDLNRFVAISLRNAGYEPTVCFDGLEALEELEKSEFHLILTDVMMPRMNGYELAESIRETDKTTPIIFMTAKDDKQSEMLGYNVGADEYVTVKEIKIGTFTMNSEERTAVVDGEEIP